MDNYTILEKGKPYNVKDIDGFRKYSIARTTELLFVYRFRTRWDWPAHKVFRMDEFKELYLDAVMTRLIACRLGMFNDSLYKSYTPEKFLADITHKQDITVYDDECVYTYISFSCCKPKDLTESINYVTKRFGNLSDKQKSVLKEISDKLSLKDIDLEKAADFALSHNDDEYISDVMNDIINLGVEKVSLRAMYDGYFSGEE